MPQTGAICPVAHLNPKLDAALGMSHFHAFKGYVVGAPRRPEDATLLPLSSIKAFLSRAWPTPKFVFDHHSSEIRIAVFIEILWLRRCKVSTRRRHDGQVKVASH